MGALRVLSLDAMGTIIRLREGAAKAYARVAHDQFGLCVDKAALGAAFRDAFRRMEQLEPCYAFAKGNWEYWWTNVIKLTFKNANAHLADNELEDMAKILIAYYTTVEPWMLTESDLIHRLADFRRHSGAQIAVVSNFGSYLPRLLAELGIEPHVVDAYFLSGELGIAKPDLKIFQRVGEHFRLGDDLATMLHVGNEPKNDYFAPKSLGIQARLYCAGCTEKIPSTIPREEIIPSLSDFIQDLSNKQQLV